MRNAVVYPAGRLRVVIPTPAVGRRRSFWWLRTVIVFALFMFVWLQLHVPNHSNCEGEVEDINYTPSSIFDLIPKDLHKYLRSRPRTHNETMLKLKRQIMFNITEIRANIEKYNEAQYIHNEDIYGPLLNDSLIVVVQVHNRITYLRHLIISLGQAQDIDTVLLVFSHDYYDEEINELVQSIDFCKVLQIFYPFSIQTHPNTFPGPSPNDCPRDMTKKEALEKGCVNAEWPDLYGHYREAKFTQTKHHWWWKANRVFSQLEATRYHTGLVLFLEEDHYVAEDFVHLLGVMEKTAKKLCQNCDLFSLGTYLKSYAYYTNSKKREALKAVKGLEIFSPSAFTPWGFEIFPSLYRLYPKCKKIRGIETDVGRIKQAGALEASLNNYSTVHSDTSEHEYEENEGTNMTMSETGDDEPNSATDDSKVSILELDPATWPDIQTSTKRTSLVELSPWVSGRHNMGMALNRTVWNKIKECATFFCTYDDYNWDWSLQNVSSNCLPKPLDVMMVRGPRVFHIGECGFHHRKNCEATTVVSRVQKVLRVARRHLYPNQLSLTESTVKKPQLKSSNGGWRDLRDHQLCLNISATGR